MYKTDDIVVSVGIAVFNAEKYIRQCLDSVLNQKTEFRFEIIVHDDASTDGTIRIIKEYVEKYPDVIIPIFQTENQYSQGKGIVSNFIIPKVKGIYFAICDGDDYWCDEYKLQKQVDFMEAHPDYALSYHPARMIYEDETHEPVIIGQSEQDNPQSYYNLTKANYIPAGSVMYRFDAAKEDLLHRPDDIYPGDWFNHISVASHGKIGYLPDVMYVYRWNSQGVSHTTSDNPEKEIHLKYGVKEVNFSYAVWNKIKDKFPQYYKEVFLRVLRDVYVAYLSELKTNEMSILQQKYSQYFKDIDFSFQDKSIIPFDKYKVKYKKYKAMFWASVVLYIILIIGYFVC